MVKLSIELKYLKPELGLYLECPESITSLASQLIMGAPVAESVYQCTGFWTLLNGQLYFLNQKVTLVQEEPDKAIFVENLKGITKGLHEIKVIFLGHIMGGWPSMWNDGSVKIKKAGEKNFAYVTGEQLFY